MGEYKIQHNDNHAGNILVQKLDEPVNLNISIGSFGTTFTTRYIVKFFDWDRAYVEGLGRNDICDDEVADRRINKFMPNRDFYLFLCSSVSEFQPSVEQILKNMIDYNVPSEYTSKKSEVISDAVTDSLLEWVNVNSEDVSINVSGTFVNIKRSELETLVSPATMLAISTKFKVPLSRIDTVYFKIIGRNIYLLPGFYCHPLIDLNDINIKKLFEDDTLFMKLCSGLNFTNARVTLRYIFQSPSVEAITPPKSLARTSRDVIANPFDSRFEMPSFSKPIVESEKDYHTRMQHLFSYTTAVFSTVGNWTQIPRAVQYISNTLSGTISFQDFLVLISGWINYSLRFIGSSNILNFSFQMLKWIMNVISVDIIQNFMSVFTYLYELVPSRTQYKDAFLYVFNVPSRVANAIISQVMVASINIKQLIDNLVEQSQTTASRLFGTVDDHRSKRLRDV